MDPVANIAEQKTLATKLLNSVPSAGGFVDTPARIEDAERLAELVLAQDEWRSNNGFDPYENPDAYPSAAQMRRVAILMREYSSPAAIRMRPFGLPHDYIGVSLTAPGLEFGIDREGHASS